MNATTFTSSAPVRLDLAGGWTDVEPIASQIHGVVVNAAVELRTRVTVNVDRHGVLLHSEDLNVSARAAVLRDLAPPNALRLHCAALRASGLTACEIHSRATAPSGSGLGTSGALGVALVHALATAQGKQLDPATVADCAWRIETVDAGVAGGRQDQYAAALGGFQRLTFGDGTTTAQRIALAPELLDQLAARIVICHTGHSRFSGDTISRVIAAATRGDTAVCNALSAMRDLAQAAPEILASGDLVRLGRLIGENWTQQLQLDAAMETPTMATLAAAMHAAGASGGKAAGSGAGGVMFFVVPGSIDRARAAAKACGATVLPTVWASEGVRREIADASADRIA